MKFPYISNLYFPYISRTLEKNLSVMFRKELFKGNKKQLSLFQLSFRLEGQNSRNVSDINFKGDSDTK